MSTALLAFAVAGTALAQAPLQKVAELRLSLVGVSATVDPLRPVVPKNIASAVRIVVRAGGSELSAADVARFLGAGFEVEAELSGPGLRETLTLPHLAPGESRPADPLLLPLPALSVSGAYELQNLRIVAGGRVLDVSPSRVTLQVIEQVLVTSVKTRPLTLDEIKEKGIVLDRDDYLGFEFTLGLKLESKPVDFSFPVVFDSRGVPVPQPIQPPPTPLRQGVAAPAVPLPTIVPMLLEATGPDGRRIPLTLPSGHGEVRIPSVLVIPGNVGYLKQFFSAMLFVANGAPVGSGLVVRDVTGTIELPPSPGAGEDQPHSLPETVNGTQPATLAVKAPGPDGAPGTPDDEGVLAPGAQGEAEFLVRGDREGFHALGFDVAAVLDGLPTGPVTLKGRASGGVLVRNAFFDVSFTVPSVVRRDEQFKLFVTLRNTGLGAANLVNVSLSGLQLSGAHLVDEATATQVIPTVAPGDARTLEYLFQADVTGQVVAKYLRFDTQQGGAARGTVNFTLGVGERGVPLSPDTLVLPTATDALVDPSRPDGADVVRAAMRVLGQAWSIANAPGGTLPKDVTRTSKAVVTQKALALAEAGLRVSLGQAPEDAIRDVAFDFWGGAPLDPGFDQLLRESDAGQSLSRALGARLAAALQAAGGPVAYEQQVAEVAASGPDFLSFAIGAASGPRPVEVALRDGAGRSALVPSGDGTGDAPLPNRLPGGVLVPLGAPETAPVLGLVMAPTSSPYTIELFGREAAPFDVALSFPRGDGSFARAEASGVVVPVGAKARLVVDLTRPESVTLQLDADGDGAFDSSQAFATTSVSVQGPSLVAAAVIGPETLDGASPFGQHLALLFDRVVGPESSARLAGYTIADNAVRAARRQLSGRLVFASLVRPEGPYVPAAIEAAGMLDTRGNPGPAVSRPLAFRIEDPGAVVTGRVLNGDGSPVTTGSVTYLNQVNLECVPQPIHLGLAEIPLGPGGQYELRYVRQDHCGQPFRIVTRDPATGATREVSAHVRAAGEAIVLDVVLFGRGSVAGVVKELATGQPVPGAQVVALSVTEPQVGGTALTDGLGQYRIDGITVGPVSVRAAKGIAAGRSSGRIDRAGTTATVDVAMDAGSVSVSGRVFKLESGKPAVAVPGVQVLYTVIDNGSHVVGVAQTDAAGSYRFERMPAGQFRIDAAINSRDTGSFSGTLAPGGTLERDSVIEIPPDPELGTIRGFVRTARGEAAPGVVVSVSDRGALSSSEPGSEGRFTITGVPLGVRFVSARTRDGLRSGFTSASLTSAAREADVVVTLSGLGSAEFSVFDAAGSPLPQAEVRLRNNCLDPCGCAPKATGADGKVRFDDLPVGPVYVKAFLSGASGFDVADAQASVARDGDVGTGVLRFAGSGRVQGVVVDPAGEPAFGADVTLRSRVFTNDGYSTCGLVSAESHRARTGLDGKFRFEGVSAGLVGVTATEPFHPTPVGGQGTLVAGGPALEFRLQLAETTAGELTGRVFLPDGTPAGKGVLVTANGPLPDVTVRTDEDSVYRFAKIFPAGLYTLTAGDPASGGTAQAKVYLRTGQPAEHDFRLKGKGTVRVRVVDGADRPVLNALVRLEETEYPGRRFEAVVEPANQGVVTFPAVFEGPLSVSAQDAFARGGRVSSVLPGPGETVEIKVRLTVTGRVAGHFVMPGPERTPIPLGVVRLLAGGRELGRITTQSAGDVGGFAFDYVPAGPVKLEAQDPLTARTGESAGAIDEEGQLLQLDVVAQSLGAVEGHVTLNGQPEPGAHVDVVSGGFKACTSADVDGYYLMTGVPAGRVVVTASRGNGLLAGTAAAELVQEGERLELDVALRDAGSVSGKVVAADGDPAPVSIVTIEVGGAGGGRQSVPTRPEDGGFRFDLVPAGFATLTVDVLGSLDHAETGVEVPAGGEAVVPDIRLNGLGPVTVRVTDADDALVFGAEVTLVALGQHYRGQTPIDSNEVVFPDVPAGYVTAYARDSRGLVGEKAGVLSTAGATLVVRLQPAGRIEGPVSRAAGGPAAGVRVTLGSRGVTTDASGYYAFADVPHGPFTLTAAEPGTGDLARFDGGLLAGPLATADMTLNGVAPVHVSVTDATGQALLGAQVIVDSLGPFLGQWTLVSNELGEARFPSVLAAPSLRVRASWQGVYADTTAGPLVAGVELRVSLPFPPMGAIRAAVKDPTGAGVEGATVNVSGRTGLSGPGGVFELAPLPLGTHTLSVLVGGRQRAYQTLSLSEAEPVWTRDVTLVGVGTVRGTVTNAAGQGVANATVTLRGRAPDGGVSLHTATTYGTGGYAIADVPVGPFDVTATRGQDRADRTGLQMPAHAAEVGVDLELAPAAIALPATLYDGNLFPWVIQKDGAANPQRNMLFEAPKLRLSQGATTIAFAGPEGAGTVYVPTEENRREVVLRQQGLFGLDVTRKVYLPIDGYFVRWLELLENPGALPVTVDVEVASDVHAWYPDVRVVRSSSGDDTLGPEDSWVVLDDQEDPAGVVLGNGSVFGPIAAVFSGADAARPPSDAGYDPATRRLLTRWTSVTVPPYGGRVAFLHALSLRSLPERAQAGAERLAALPPELVLDLAPGEKAAVVNFAVQGASALLPLPANDGTLTGRVLAGDGRTPVPFASGSFTSASPYYDRPLRVDANNLAEFTLRADLTTGAHYTKVVPREAYRLDFGHQLGTLRATTSASGAFTGPSSDLTVVFDEAGLVKGTVRRAGGSPLANSPVTLSDGSASATLYTNAAGEFLFPVVPPGSYSLTAAHPLGGASVSAADVGVSAGATTTRDLAFPPMGSLSGTVRSAANLGLASMQVRLTAPGFDRYVYTGAGGAYLFTDVPPGAYTATARDGRSQAQVAQPVTVPESPAAQADFTFPPVGSLRVKVTVGGKGLYPALVYARMPARQQDWLFLGYTDQLGILTHAGVPGPEVEVRAHHPKAPASVVYGTGRIANEADEASVTLALPGVGRLTGRVLTRDGVEKTTGVTLRVLHETEPTELRPALNLTASPFTLADVPAGRFRLLAEPVGFDSGGYWTYSLGQVAGELLSDGDELALDVRIPSSTIAVQDGRELWEFDGPLTTTLLAIAQPNGPAMALADPQLQLLGPDGSVVGTGTNLSIYDRSDKLDVDLPAGRYTVVVTAAAGQSGGYRLATYSRPNTPFFRPHTGRILAGRVTRDTDGRAIAGLRVRFTEPGKPSQEMPTDAAGGYLFPRFTDAEATVEVLDAEAVLIAAGTTAADGLDLVVPARGSVTVAVKRGPFTLPGVTVTFESDHASASADDKLRTKTTSASGEASAVLPVGTITATATDPESGLPHSASGVLAADGSLSLVVALPVNETTVTGTVTNGDGQSPLAGVSVEVTGTGGTFTQATDAQGQYRITRVPSGTYTIRWTYAASTQSETGLVLNGGTLERNLSFAVPVLRGRVQEPDGRGVEAARVFLCGYYSGCGGTSVDSLADGSFAFQGHTASGTSVYVRAELTDGSGLTQASDQVFVPYGFTGTTVLNVTLPGTASLTGIVSRAGQPVEAGVIVGVYQPGSSWPLRTGQTGLDGSYHMAHFRWDTPIRVHAQDAAGVPGQATGALALGAEETVNVTLAPPARLALRLVDEQEQPLAGTLELASLDAPEAATGGPARTAVSLEGPPAGEAIVDTFAGYFRAVYDDGDTGIGAAEGELEPNGTGSALVTRGSHVRLPQTLDGPEGSYDTNESVLQTRLQGAEEYPPYARPELEARALRGLTVAGPGVRVRREVYVPRSAAFARTLTTIHNPDPLRAATVSLESSFYANDGNAGLAATSDGNTEFQPTDGYAVVSGESAYGFVVGTLPATDASFWANNSEGFSFELHARHTLVVPAGETRAFLTFTVIRADADTEKARQTAERLLSLDEPGALAHLDLATRDAIENFDVPALADIEGTVKLDDIPVGGARVGALDADGNVVAETSAGGDGAFVLFALRPGPHSIVAWAPGSDRPGRADATVIVDTQAPVTVNLLPDAALGAVSVSGTSADTGEPAVGAGVSLVVAGYAPFWQPTLTLDANGEGTFPLAPAGPAELRWQPPYEGAPVSVGVVAGQTTPASLSYTGQPSVGLPLSLAAGGSSFDVQGSGQVWVNGGCVPFCGPALSTSGSYFPEQAEGTLRLGGREAVIGPVPFAGLQAMRRVYVPEDGRFVRVLEILDNPGGVDLDVPIEWKTYFETAGADWALDTPAGDPAAWEPDDDYLVLTAPGGPEVAHVVAGTGALARPDLREWFPYTAAADAYARWSALRVPAGGRVILMHFVVPRTDGTTGEAAAQAARLLTFQDGALLGLTQQERADVKNFLVP